MLCKNYTFWQLNEPLASCLRNLLFEAVSYKLASFFGGGKREVANSLAAVQSVKRGRPRQDVALTEAAIACKAEADKDKAQTEESRAQHLVQQKAESGSRPLARGER